MIDIVFLLLLLAGIGVGCLACIAVACFVVWRAGGLAVSLRSAPAQAAAIPRDYTDEELLDAIRTERAIAVGRALDPYGVELRRPTPSEATGWRTRAANDPSWRKPCLPCQIARNAFKRVFRRNRPAAAGVAAATSMTEGANDGKKTG